MINISIKMFLVGNSLNEDYLSQLATKVSAVIQKKVHVFTEITGKNEGVMVYDFSSSPTIP